MPCSSLGVLLFNVGQRYGVFWDYWGFRKGGQKLGPEHELQGTSTSGIYTSVTSIRACIAIVVAVVGVKDEVRVR